MWAQILAHGATFMEAITLIKEACFTIKLLCTIAERGNNKEEDRHALPRQLPLRRNNI